MFLNKFTRIILSSLTLLLSPPIHAQFLPTGQQLGSNQLALIINLEEEASIELANAYAKARGIPERNLIRVRLPNPSKSISPEAFALLKAEIDAQLDNHIQALVFVWTAPYQVGCNSLTGAYTLGYQADLCSNTCGKSKPNRYFNSPSRQPYRDLGMRLSMLLPTQPDGLGEALIERGTRADRSWPKGTAYFLRTTDSARNSRSAYFPPSGQVNIPPLRLQNIEANTLRDKDDVMFYFTGTTHVSELGTLQFLPGAIADHLTSTGGDLLGKGQMSILRWLEAGASGSYGTVTEPCNHWQKFPNPSILLKYYLNGETLIEAYWKSVAWPGQGLFVGEALASPYRWLLR
jgi:uncharacterized protein (TIGR03790 family)